MKLNSSLFSGETEDGTPVAIKFATKDYDGFFEKELYCYEKMSATTNRTCEKYGISYIYHVDKFLTYKTMAMTKLDIDLLQLHKKIGNYSRDALLIIFRDLIRTVKFAHSNGISNNDIKPDNVMLKGANVYLMGWFYCDAINTTMINIDSCFHEFILSRFQFGKLCACYRGKKSDEGASPISRC